MTVSGFETKTMSLNVVYVVS